MGRRVSVTRAFGKKPEVIQHRPSGLKIVKVTNPIIFGTVALVWTGDWRSFATLKEAEQMAESLENPQP